MNEPAATQEPPVPPVSSHRLDTIQLTWLVLTLVSFAVAAVATYRPGSGDPAAIAATILPWLTLAAIVTVIAGAPNDLPVLVRVVALGLALGGWAVLVFVEAGWSMLGFAIYAMCYSAFPDRSDVGLFLAGTATALWTGAWVISDTPPWTALVPLGVFAAGSAIWLVLRQSGRENDQQARLILQLREAQRNLAASERSKGVLEERARMAGEIHDTLAQGFASIVLLSRIARKRLDGTPGATSTIDDIEQTAQEHLDAARRLVDAIGPRELDVASLPEALERHAGVALPTEVRTAMHVTGEPRRLAGSLEVTLLRAGQEALANVAEHAHARNVDITLSYLDDAVALDIRDDGIGFTPGSVTEKGSLTGGQGLTVLSQRARSLSGELRVETRPGGPSVISILLPIGSP